ncbi:helix-turn-helix transcriptional regulator [Dysgonomonas sp. HDW5A]|uniref:helix-turn-helix domain-containing protein n=1 Tax=unclassified Dysgonomonas TaxID=2630389 RepID=UPI001408717B|nr:MULTISPECIES: helix-turn-helix transcriptional regulator [unclassified Dysgonomonas]QIK53955.1 helix-turn-helix transcriptional regulator [Dysgonomonas sp. HDW5B]QIK59404.1 helix-turn-helix transcriptional regulator [Dysgonomonas sp. HDW5A]
MEAQAETLDRPNVHQGHNVKRIRESKGISQQGLEPLVNLSQQTISRYEDKRVIDEEMLQRFAKALEVPVDTLKNLEEDACFNYYIENSTFSDHAVAIIQNNYNPLEEVIKLCNEKVELYERMLANEKEKISLLEKMLMDKK